jgi:hypothetical protein
VVECTGFEIRRTGSPVPRVRIPLSPPTVYRFGSLAQLVERLPYTQNVGSSSLSRPTIHKPPIGNGAGLLFWLKQELMSHWVGCLGWHL